MKTHGSSGARIATILTTSALLSAGCMTAQKPTGPLVPEIAPPSRVVVTEYETVSVTGSHIPARVPKGGVSQPATGASAISTMSPEQFRQIMQRAQASRR